MASFMKEFEHLKIPLEDLKKATNNFGSKVIGVGGFGDVYEGEVSHSRGRSKVAIKRLNSKCGQGYSEFLKEIVMLSRCKHKNLISLLGFCDEDGEKILVYEHASNGSLDRHLSSPTLTWIDRIKICLDAAKGLAHLHDPKDTHQRVIHRDIKSGNILLDDNWNAKLSDMGFSKIGPANQKHTYVITNAAGTLGYCDPQYMKTYSLTKESDIYSFGVVLFEVLCGRLCYTNQLEILVPKWKKSYEDNKLRQIIFKDLTPHMDPTSLKTFSDIAFQCLQDSRERRPTTSFLVKKLEIALQFQKRHDMNMTNVPTSHKSRRIDELSVPLSNGKEVLFLNTGKVVISYFDSTMPFTAVDLFCAKVETTGKSIYGSDYKATLENGFEVVVKRLRVKVTKSDTEFEAELEFIGKVRHPNLLAPRACYLDPNGDKILVFDYMRKGSLAAFLHAQGPKQRVDWPTRMQIAKGVARGLQSLHTHHNIIHGNLTSSNILLDENINPKISGFGLSRLMNTDEHSHMISTAFNLGYQAPEVTKLNKANTKADVYSLGMIMLELLTGKSPGEVRDLPQWVHLTTKQEWTSKVFDRELKEDDTVGDDELLNSLKLALRCVHPLPHDRPHVKLVLQKLEEIRPETATTLNLH